MHFITKGLTVHKVQRLFRKEKKQTFGLFLDKKYSKVDDFIFS